MLDLNNILLLLNYSNKTPTKCNDDVNSDDEKTCTDKIKTDQTISIVLPVAIISIDDANVTQNSVEKIREPIKRVLLTMLCLIKNKMCTMKYYHVIKTGKADKGKELNGLEASGCRSVNVRSKP